MQDLKVAEQRLGQLEALLRNAREGPHRRALQQRVDAEQKRIAQLKKTATANAPKSRATQYVKSQSKEQKAEADEDLMAQLGRFKK